MPREVMNRSAADNAYLHKDFHGGLSGGIQYLDERYGPEAVKEYLHRFASTFYAPLKQAIKERGLAALKEHYEYIYEVEDGDVEFELSDDELVMRVAASPAVMHMRQHNYPVADRFEETVRSVNEGICEGTGYAAELVEYDVESGASVQRFYRRAS